MNDSRLIFNSILFNQVPAAEALKGNKQKFIMKKLNSLNNLFITKTSNYTEIMEKAKQLRISIEKGIKSFEIEANNKLMKLYRDKNIKESLLGDKY